MPLPLPEVTKIDRAFPSDAVNWIPANVIPREAWEAGLGTGKMPKDVPSSPGAATRYAHYHRMFQDIFFRGRGPRQVRIRLKAGGPDVAHVWNALNCTMGCFGFSHEHKEAAWVFAADEWTCGIWFEGEDAPPWAPSPDGYGAQIQALLDAKLIDVETAETIVRECGDNDIGLFLGQLLATGRIGPEVVQAHLARAVEP